MIDTKNNIELIGTYGGDIEHALSAWTSTSRELTDEKIERIPNLLKKLVEGSDGQSHGTPFEKSSLHFLVTAEMASHIHLLKHRIGVSINCECLTADTKITFLNSSGHTNCKSKVTLNELWKQWNSGRSHQNTEKDKEYQRNRIRNRKLRVYDEDTNKFTIGNIKDIYYSGKKEVFLITLKNGKSIKCSENHPLFTDTGWASLSSGLKLGDKVGTNGIKIEDPVRPWTFKEFFDNASDYTRMEFSILKGIKYPLCKKWGYFWNIQFAEDINKDFKTGHISWNTGVKGYKINIGNRKHNPHKGQNCHFWRGGITEDRANIGVWTTRNARKVHEKYNFTCQSCGISSGYLVAHHIIPVAQDISKAYEFNNLITVCNECHKNIHKTLENELSFADKVSDNGFITFEYKKRIGERHRIFAPHFSEIVSIESMGEEDTYDIEVDGPHKNFIANGLIVHNSARYKELKGDSFYLPNDWPNIEREALRIHCLQCFERYHQVLESLIINYNFDRKRAKESARFYLPYSSKLIFDVMFNFRSFAHFVKLRGAPGAQLEIRQITDEMIRLVKETGKFTHSLDAWGIK